MKIKQITIKNVKSFKNETIIDFDDELNILIGPNSGGKSNLLSIITIVMNHYFYAQYQFHFRSQEGDKIFEEAQQQTRFGNINLELDKFFGDSSESKIIIKLQSDTTDYENMKCISEHKEMIAQRQHMYGSSVKLDSPENWENMFREPKELTYEINNCNFVQPESNSNEQVFLYYLKNYNTYRWYSDEMESLNLFTPMLFFPPSRSLSGQFKIDQSNIKTTYYYSTINSVSSIHSRAQNASLSQIAIMHFGRLYKHYTWKAANTRDDKTVSDLFNEDNEVKQLTKYLGKIGYSWKLKEDRPLNQYTFVLSKGDTEFDFTKASSGEQEILNFLLGIFCLNVQGGVVFIDEPEVHLHPKWQNLLIDIITDLSTSRGVQFIITTHSPSFVNSNTYSYIIRVYKENNSSKVVVLKDVDPFPLKDVLHIINGTNNEKMFFSDAVILVEGLTDRLVFAKLLEEQTSRDDFSRVIEVIEVKGKGNRDKFKKFLDNLRIPSFFIADLDYVNQVGTDNIKKLFETNKSNIDSDVIKNPKSRDGDALVDTIEAAVATHDTSALSDLLDYIKNNRTKLRASLSGSEEKTLSDFIASKRTENTFILRNGDIEDYFPTGYKAKDILKVIELLKDEPYENWKNAPSSGHAYLKEIITDILSKL